MAAQHISKQMLVKWSIYNKASPDKERICKHSSKLCWTIQEMQSV